VLHGEENRLDYFTRRDLEVLIQEVVSPCISIYLPTERTGPESEKDRILLKNLLKDARDRLGVSGKRRDEIAELVSPAERLLDATSLWPCGCDGMALFRSPRLFRRFRLPVRFEPLAVVSDRFHIKPLLPLLTVSGSFHILALSRVAVRLYHATRQQVSETELPNAPAGVDDTLRFDDPEKQLQFHTGTRSPGGMRPAMYHGQGVGMDDSESNTLRFLKEVDQAVNSALGEEMTPLVLAAVEEIQGLYRRVNGYRQLTEQAIVHNPEDLTAEELRSRAWRIVEPLFRGPLREASETYGTLAGHDSGQSVSEIGTILRAAVSGQVGTLFVRNKEHIWGRYDRESGAVELVDDGEVGSLDLLDLAAAETLLHGGRVFAVDPEEVPGGGTAAAILRYPASRNA
jgi:hypothetical protein